jgi:hypothetical protein
MLTNPTNIEKFIKTRDGANVILLAEFEDQERCFIGVYWDNEKWVACSWLKCGFYLDKGECGLDLKGRPIIHFEKDMA